MSNLGGGTLGTSPLALTTGVGGLDDSVKLAINETTILIAEGWNVHEGVLSQPATWEITIGSGTLVAQLRKQYPPGPQSVIRLFIGNVLQQSGYIDGVEAVQADRSATKFVIRGRDAMTPLQDTYVAASVAVNVTTYADLVWFALRQVGLAHGPTIDPNVLSTDNNANRKLKAGVPIAGTLPHRTVQQILDDIGKASTGTITSPPQAKLHETWHHFIRRHIDRAGLMFWAAGDGSFVLAAPDSNQAPTYVLRRKTGQPVASDRANVTAMRWVDDRTHRHSEVIVYGKGGGLAQGRAKSKGSFADAEMQASGYAHQPIVFRDGHTKSPAEAVFFARRKLAEERRAGWHLEYTVSGHTLPFAGDGGRSRAVIIPDTVVSVDDDELGMHDNFYIESVDRRRGPHTSTTIRLMRLEDFVFGADDEE